MPEYLAPGVYIEEIAAGPQPIQGVSTSTAAFLGATERGPLRPRLVTSYGEYVRLFGDPFGPDEYLPPAVRLFFDNGGRRCYIGRIVGRGAATAELTVAGFRIRAVGPGAAYTRLWIRMLPGTTRDAAGAPIGFRLQVFYWADPDAEIAAPAGAEGNAEPTYTAFEDFDDLSVDPSSPSYFEERVNGGNSSFIELFPADPQRPVALPTEEVSRRLADQLNPGEALTTADYEGDAGADPGERTGLAALELAEYRAVSLVYAPGVEPATAKAIIDHCENDSFRFAVIDAPPDVSDAVDLAPRRDLQDSRYAAYYHPWLWVPGPAGAGRVKVPPGGAVCGIYARTDDTRGVFKAPANQLVTGAVDVVSEIDEQTQGVLNPKGVNAIRRFPNRGIRVWGARTLSSEASWRYVNVSRLFLFLEASIQNSIRWVVFEPNDERLWAEISLAVTRFLDAQWRAGALAGSREEEAFRVTVGRETMTEDDITNGRLIIEIGVAPVRPAEFEIFRVFQRTLEPGGGRPAGD